MRQRLEIDADSSYALEFLRCLFVKNHDLENLFWLSIGACRNIFLQTSSIYHRVVLASRNMFGYPKVQSWYRVSQIFVAGNCWLETLMMLLYIAHVATHATPVFVVLLCPVSPSSKIIAEEAVPTSSVVSVLLSSGSDFCAAELRIAFQTKSTELTHSTRCWDGITL